MDKKYIIELIENNTKYKVLKVKYFFSVTSKKKCYIVMMSNNKKYIMKCVKFYNKEHFDIYMNIQNKNIPSFQFLYKVIEINKNEYFVLYEWVDGTGLENVSTYREHYIKAVIQSANEIRIVHNKNVTNKRILITEDMIYQSIQFDFMPKQHKDIMYNYIISKMELLNNRFQTVVHGDLHLHNIISNDNKITFIDTDDVKYSDAYSDLVYVANLHQKQEEDEIYYLFLQVYFNYYIPKEFWEIVNCYTLAKLMYIVNYEMKVFHKTDTIGLIERFILSHDNMESDEPDWYKRMKMKKF